MSKSAGITICGFLHTAFITSSESPDDFTSLTSTPLTFGRCKRRTCINIHLVDDSIVEMTESFIYSLSRTTSLDSRITLGLADGVIEIVDND